jgi:uncharacterized membrane protein YdjX (TVP38/TMEM64 family)
MNPTQKTRILLLLLAGSCLLLFAIFIGNRYLNLEFLQENIAAIRAYKDANLFKMAALYFCGYIIATSLSVPGAIWLTMLGGAIFGLATGTVLVSFANAIGATGAFLSSRYLLHDWVQSRYGDYLEPVNRGIEREGLFFLFSLRMNPALPYFVLNLLMGLTPMRTLPYYIATQTGMLIITLVYVNAGSQLSQINAVSEIISLPIMLSIILLGLIPLLTKYAILIVRRILIK